MDFPDPGDAGIRQHPVPVINPYFLLASFALLLLIACQQKEKQSAPAIKTAADSLPLTRKPLRDSLQMPAPARKKIYITFDDGPNAGTQNVLDAVVAEQVPVSFFIVAKHVYDSREQYKVWEQLKNTSGIELCNHSYSHAGNRYSRFYQEPRRVISDFIRSRDSLQFSNKVVRMPGRNAWRIGDNRHTDVRASKEAIDSVAAAGFSVMGWDVEWGFDHQTFVPDADTSLMYRRIENLFRDSATRAPGHLVLLAHDQAFRTEADILLLRAVLSGLKRNPEYELVLASSYPGVR